MKQNQFGFACSWDDARSWATDAVQSMAMAERVGQLLAPRALSYFRSGDDSDYQQLFDFVERFHVGGFVFFQGEVFGQAILANELQRASKTPLLFSQDAEWGVGMRLPDTTTFPSMMAIGATGTEQHAFDVGRVTAIESKTLGVHLVFAPVADLNNNPSNPIINVRSFGENPREVSRFVRNVVSGLQSEGVLATVKHFPGHGDTAVDSHSALPVLSVDRDRLDAVELVPFKDSIEHGVAAVMIGHLALPNIDDSGLPASLSPVICRDLLRGELGFTGLVVSDAMDMHGVQSLFPAGEAAVRAVQAGIDLLCTPPDVEAAFDAILEAIDSGRLSVDRVTEAAVNVMAAKALVGLTDSYRCQPESVRSTVASSAHQKLALNIAEDGITVLKGSLPLDAAEPLLHLIFSDLRETDGVGSVVRAAVRVWHGEDGLAQIAVSSEPAAEDFESVLRRAASFESILVTSFVAVRSFSGKIGLPEKQRQILDTLVASGKHVTFVSLGSPYVTIGLESQPEAVVLAYGGSPSAQRAAANVLFGQRAARGRLPVTIPGLYERGDGLGDAR